MLIERLFSRFSSLYGAAFGRQWDGTDLQDVKLTWAEKLGGFTPEQIGVGLKSCDDRQYPPNLPEFIGLCRARVQQDVKRIGAPTISREQAEQNIQRAAVKLPKMDNREDSKGWATRLRERYLAGEILMHVQVTLASEALHEIWKNRECKARISA